MSTGTLTQLDILELIKTALGLPKDHDIDLTVRPAFVPGWDSVGWMNVIVLIEERAQCEIPLEALDDIVTVEDVCRVVLSETNRA